MHCEITLSASSNPYAMAVHHAGHAVALFLAGVRIVTIELRRNGTRGLIIADDMPPKVTLPENLARRAAEGEALTRLAALEAQKRAVGGYGWGYSSPEMNAVDNVLRCVEKDDNVRAAWFRYHEERARVLMSKRAVFADVSAVAGQILLHGTIAGDAIEAMLRENEQERGELKMEANCVGLPVRGEWPTL
jgi:hypothetical protein